MLIYFKYVHKFSYIHENTIITLYYRTIIIIASELFLEYVKGEGSLAPGLTWHPGGEELMEDLQKTRLMGAISA